LVLATLEEVNSTLFLADQAE